MKLMDAVQDALRVKNYAYSTEKTYLHWIRQYVRFHLPAHPRDVGAEGVTKFLTYLAKERNVSASTQIRRWRQYYFFIGSWVLNWATLILCAPANLNTCQPF